MVRHLSSVGSAIFLGAIVLGAGVASSQDYPNKPIRIVTTDVGNNNDFFARVIAQGLTARMGQQVIVENHGGAGGFIAADKVIKAQPDGYTLMVHGTSIWLYPLMDPNAPWDPFRDFSPVSIIGKNSAVLVVNPSLQVKTVKELIAFARAKPGYLNYASTDDGSPTHLAAELFNSMAGVKIVRIAYKGGSQSFASLVSGETHVMAAAIAPAMPHIKSGRLTALAVTSPTVMLPNLPNVADTLPGYEWITHQIMMTAPKTPPALINRINAEVARVLTSPEYKEKLLNAGAVAATSTPAELTTMMKTEMARMGKVIKAANIRVN